MKVTEELVDYISTLSRLALPQDEKVAMMGDLERIIGYMDSLDQLDVAGVEPMSHVVPVSNVFRADEVETSFDRAALLANAPVPDKETFLVPKSVD